MIFFFDIDGTVVPEDNFSDRKMQWLPGVVDGLKSMLRAGHKITFWTARGAEEFGGVNNPRFKEAVEFIHETFPDLDVLPKPYFHYAVDDRVIPVGRAPNSLGIKWVFEAYGSS